MVRPLVIGIIVALVAVAVMISVVAIILIGGGSSGGGGGPPLSFNYSQFKFEDVGLNFSFEAPQGWTQSRNGAAFVFSGPSFPYQDRVNVTTKLEGEYFNGSSSANSVMLAILARFAAMPDYSVGGLTNATITTANNSTLSGLQVVLSYSSNVSLDNNSSISVPLKRQVFVLDSGAPYYAVSLEALAPELERVSSAFDRAKNSLAAGPGLPPPEEEPPQPQVCATSCAAGFTQNPYPDCACIPPPLPGGTATLPANYLNSEAFSFNKGKVESARTGGVTGDGGMRYLDGKEISSPLYVVFNLGEIDFDALTSWKREVGTSSVSRARDNYVYIIRTASKRWAKIKVISAQAGELTFQWVYNPNDQEGETISFQP
ncbi:hypothetical protein HYS54_03365 [Candidatus Micrarchaeota archaeon]|nr:hypothetical protein [Candidatus Micrarchaeota archaeon]